MSVVIKKSKVSKEAINSGYAGVLETSLQKFLRAVTGRPVYLELLNSSPHRAPAWSIGDDVSIVYDTSRPLISSEQIIRLKGLAIHEASHVMFTPRHKTALAKWAADKTARMQVFNLLEDSRIENIMVAKMSGVAPWLQHVVVTEIMNTAINDSFPLIYGRKYLPLKLRMLSERNWSKPDITAELKQIIDSYIVLSFPDKTNEETARILIDRMVALLEYNVPNTHHKTDSSAPASTGDSKPVSKREQEKLVKEVKDKVDDQQTLDDEYQVADDNDTESDDSQDTLTLDGHPVASDCYEDVKAFTEYREALTNAKQSANQALLDDVKETIRSIRGDDVAVKAVGRKNTLITLSKLNTKSVSESVRQQSLRFAQELVNIKSLFDPGWLRRESTGRINARNFMIERNINEAFDLWDSGREDATDIEAVVLLDVSGSMQPVIEPAFEAMWAIKRALDSVNASTTVIAFGEDAGVMYKSTEKASTKMPSATARYALNTGGTKPVVALEHARNLLLNSSRANKLLIVITDGAWGDASKCEQAILTLRKAGVLTGLMFLPDVHNLSHYRSAVNNETDYHIDGHFCEVVTSAMSPTAIIDFARDLTKLSRKRLLAHN